jgi:hypothetical protein
MSGCHLVWEQDITITEVLERIGSVFTRVLALYTGTPFSCGLF